MAYKNPFDHSSRGKAADTGDSKVKVNPFDRSRSIGKSAAKGPPRSAIATMKPAGKSSLEKMRELAEKRKAGLLKSIAPKKVVAAPAPPAARVAFAAANGGGAITAQRPAAAADNGPQAPVNTAPTGRPSAMGGAGPAGAQAASVPAAAAPAGEQARSAMGGAGTGTKAASTPNYKAQWVKNDAPTTASVPSVTAKPQKPEVSNVAMTSENYTQVYKEETLGIKGAASQPMTSDNYMEVYKQQSMGLDGIAAEAMTSDNYTKVYQQQEQQRAVQKAVVQQAKQMEAAATETKKMLQKNAQLAGQAQGLYAKLAHLRGSLGKGPDEDASTHAAISQVEAALAQIPTGLR